MQSLPMLDANVKECPDGCGLCCAEQGTPPMLPDERAKLPPELLWDIHEHADRYDRGLPCLWFDTTTKRCRHYEYRPQACREAVLPGDEHCNEFRTGSQS